MYFWLPKDGCDSQTSRAWAITVVWIQLFQSTFSVLPGILLCSCSQVFSLSVYAIFAILALSEVQGMNNAAKCQSYLCLKKSPNLWDSSFLALSPFLVFLYDIKILPHFTRVTLRGSWKSCKAQGWHQSHFSCRQRPSQAATKCASNTSPDICNSSALRSQTTRPSLEINLLSLFCFLQPYFCS